MSGATPSQDSCSAMVEECIQACPLPKFATLMRQALNEYLILNNSKRRALCGNLQVKVSAIQNAVVTAQQVPKHDQAIFEATSTFCEQYPIGGDVAHGQVGLQLRLGSFN